MSANVNLIRRKGENLEKEYLEQLEVGDKSIWDEVTQWRITRVPNGLIYASDYAGAVFVPYEPPKHNNITNPARTAEAKKVVKPAPEEKVVKK